MGAFSSSSFSISAFSILAFDFDGGVITAVYNFSIEGLIGSEGISIRGKIWN